MLPTFDFKCANVLEARQPNSFLKSTTIPVSLKLATEIIPRVQNTAITFRSTPSYHVRVFTPVS